MKFYPNGTRYDYIGNYEERLNQPYDYEKNGLVQHIMSARIVNSKNPITAFLVRVFEKNIVMLLKMTDILANFKNPHFKNR
jgi:hypothetical protein